MVPKDWLTHGSCVCLASALVFHVLEAEQNKYTQKLQDLDKMISYEMIFQKGDSRKKKNDCNTAV